MRRSILLLILIALATLVIVLPSKAPSLDTETTPEITPEVTLDPSHTPHPSPAPILIWPPVTPPLAALSEDDLIAIAADIAVLNGLESFEGPPFIKWMTMAEHERSLGSHSAHPQDTIVVTVAFRGSGTYRGVGGGFIETTLDGFTVTLNPLNGTPITTEGGFRELANAVQIDAARFPVRIPTLAPG